VSDRVAEWRRRAGEQGRHYVSDAGWGLALEITVLGGSILTFLLLARGLGPAGYGYYAAIQGLVSLARPLVAGWSGLVLLEDAIRDRLDLRRSYREMLLAVGVMAVIVLVVTVGIAHPLLPRVSVVTTVTFVAAEVVGNSSVSLPAAAIQASRGFASSARARLAEQALQALAIVVLWAVRDLTLSSVAVATLAVNVATGAVVGFVCARVCSLPPGGRFPRWEQLRRGGMYAVVLLCFGVEEDADKTLLVRDGYDTTAGLYAAGYRLVQIGLLPLRVLTSATHNKFLEHDDSAIGQHWRRSVRFTLPSAAYGVVATGGLVLLAPLAPLVLGHAYRGSVVMIRLLALLILFRSLTVFAFNGLMGLGCRAWRTSVLLAAAVVNLALNLTLIPVLSWRGCVVATLAGETVYLSLTWIGLHHFQRLHDRRVQE